MQGFSGFIASWFFMFLFGSLFGKLMEDCGAAESVARWVIAHRRAARGAGHRHRLRAAHLMAA